MTTYFIYAVFFLSGASALIFETIWFRLAGLIFGNSVWSAALVLSGFMAGLAFGNLLTARYGHQLKNPVKFYSKLELAIGMTGMSLVLLFPFFENILKPVFSPFLDIPLILNPLRLGIAFILILIPTTAMGATLPILVKALCNNKEKFGSVLGRLYGWNTLGAVAGSLASEIFLIKLLGIQGTGLTAVLLNLLAAYCAFRMSGSPELKAAGSASAGKAPFNVEGVTRQGSRLLLAAFLAGGILLALEVVWFRFLLLTRSGTSLIFAVMLATVLSGIGIGGLLASWLYRRQGSVHSYLRTLTLFSGILIVVAYRGFDWVFNAVQGLNKLSGIISISEFILLALFLMLPVLHSLRDIVHYVRPGGQRRIPIGDSCGRDADVVKHPWRDVRIALRRLFPPSLPWHGKIFPNAFSRLWGRCPRDPGHKRSNKQKAPRPVICRRSCFFVISSSLPLRSYVRQILCYCRR